MGIWYAPSDPTPREVCPCCDFVTLPERFSYLICPVCFWEDDGVDVDDLDSLSGPNHMSLRQGRANFAEFGACDEKMLANVCTLDERKQFEHRPRDVA